MSFPGSLQSKEGIIFLVTLEQARVWHRIRIIGMGSAFVSDMPIC